MESAFYRYYYISTDCIENKWNTMDVERFISNYGGFVQTEGGFKHISSFCDIQLLNIKNYESWNSNDYDKMETNYISITTSKILVAETVKFFEDFELFIGWRICEETDDTNTTK